MLVLTARVLKVELLAKKIRQLGPLERLFLILQQLEDIFDGLGCRQRALDLILRFHADYCAKKMPLGQFILRANGGARVFTFPTMVGRPILAAAVF